MESKQNYFLVGVFVSIGTILLIVFGVWLASGRTQKDVHPYFVFFSDSVTGLNAEAIVRYRGVEVGKVEHIKIDEEDTSRIRIRLQIAEGTPIKQNTVATLKFQGITGVSYVDLGGGTNDSPKLEPNDDKPPTIQSSPSQLDKVVTQIPLVVDKISAMADRLSKLADEETLGHLRSTLENIDRVSGAFGSNSGNISKLIEQMAQATQNLAQATQTINKTVQDSKQDTRQALQDAGRAMREMAELLQRTNQFSDSGLKETQNLLIELKKTAREVQDLSRQFKDNPSAVISPTKESGVRLP